MPTPDVTRLRAADLLHALLEPDDVSTNEAGVLVATTFDPDRTADWWEVVDVLTRYGSFTLGYGDETTYVIEPGEVARLADDVGWPPGWPRALTLRPATVEEAIALIEAAVATGHRVVVADLPTDGLLLGGRS